MKDVKIPDIYDSEDSHDFWHSYEQNAYRPNGPHHEFLRSEIVSAPRTADLTAPLIFKHFTWKSTATYYSNSRLGQLLVRPQSSTDILA